MKAQERACKAVEMILSRGTDAAMNEFNKKDGGRMKTFFAASAESCRDGTDTGTGKKITVAS